MYVVGRTDNYSEVNGLQMDQPPTLGILSVKTVIVLPSRSAAGIIQFPPLINITGLREISLIFIFFPSRFLVAAAERWITTKQSH